MQINDKRQDNPVSGAKADRKTKEEQNHSQEKRKKGVQRGYEGCTLLLS